MMARRAVLVVLLSFLAVSAAFNTKGVPEEVLHFVEKEMNHETGGNNFARIIEVGDKPFRVVKDRLYELSLTFKDTRCTKDYVGCDTEIEQECQVATFGKIRKCRVVVVKANWADNPLTMNDLKCDQ